MPEILNHFCVRLGADGRLWMVKTMPGDIIGNSSSYMVCDPINITIDTKAGDTLPYGLAQEEMVAIEVPAHVLMNSWIRPHPQNNNIEDNIRDISRGACLGICTETLGVMVARYDPGKNQEPILNDDSDYIRLAFTDLDGNTIPEKNIVPHYSLLLADNLTGIKSILKRLWAMSEEELEKYDPWIKHSKASILDLDNGFMPAPVMITHPSHNTLPADIAIIPMAYSYEASYIGGLEIPDQLYCVLDEMEVILDYPFTEEGALQGFMLWCRDYSKFGTPTDHPPSRQSDILSVGEFMAGFDQWVRFHEENQAGHYSSLSSFIRSCHFEISPEQASELKNLLSDNTAVEVFHGLKGKPGFDSITIKDTYPLVPWLAPGTSMVGPSVWTGPNGIAYKRLCDETLALVRFPLVGSCHFPRLAGRLKNQVVRVAYPKSICTKLRCIHARSMPREDIITVDMSSNRSPGSDCVFVGGVKRTLGLIWQDTILPWSADTNQALPAKSMLSIDCIDIPTANYIESGISLQNTLMTRHGQTWWDTSDSTCTPIITTCSIEDDAHRSSEDNTRQPCDLQRELPNTLSSHGQQKKFNRFSELSREETSRMITMLSLEERQHPLMTTTERCQTLTKLLAQIVADREKLECQDENIVSRQHIEGEGSLCSRLDNAECVGVVQSGVAANQSDRSDCNKRVASDPELDSQPSAKRVK